MPTLNWIGKDAVVNHHLAVPFRLLVDVPELACEQPHSLLATTSANEVSEVDCPLGQPQRGDMSVAKESNEHRLAQIKQPTAAQRRDYSCSNGAVSPFGCEGRDELPCESATLQCESGLCGCQFLIPLPPSSSRAIA